MKIIINVESSWINVLEYFEISFNYELVQNMIDHMCLIGPNSLKYLDLFKWEEKVLLFFLF